VAPGHGTIVIFFALVLGPGLNGTTLMALCVGEDSCERVTFPDPGPNKPLPAARLATFVTCDKPVARLDSDKPRLVADAIEVPHTVNPTVVATHASTTLATGLGDLTT
jgi:hypothetical protein